jgi:hypothetical protein
MKRSTTLWMVCLSMAVLALRGYGQGKKYEGPIDPAGDISMIRSGFMNGNRYYMYFENSTQIADYPNKQTNFWPNNSEERTRLMDVCAVMIGSEVVVYRDSTPVDDLSRRALLSASEPQNLDTLYFIESHSYNDSQNDKNFDQTVEWGLYPVKGYFNETQDYPGMSNKPNSWPPGGWPSTGFEKKWPGEWNGRFGRGIMKAALESYVVANDAQDLEYIVQRTSPTNALITGHGPDSARYYPRPGRKIGDFDPAVTIQKGLPWGGLGLRVQVRGYQWNNFEAQDIIFWEYDIANISDYNLPTSGFGYYIDNSIGDDTGNDNEPGFFSSVLDLAYVWEKNGANGSAGGKLPGVSGIAFLESPGIAYDGVDNDEDGLVDEQRDNPAGEKVGPTAGIADMAKFLSFYNLKESELKEHFQGDEDQDWQDGIDPDGDGRYADQDKDGNWVLEAGAYAGDDVGLDGVGPLDLNYKGPDEGECNHKPDYKEGVGCEPNFNATDINESDMLGLTSFLMFDWTMWTSGVGLDSSLSGGLLMNKDRNVWRVMQARELTDFFATTTNIGSMYEIFASAVFPFHKGRTERISMGMMATYENLATLNGPTHEAPRMYRLKEIAQTIYEHDYQFAQPPLLPTLKATAGEGKVVLTWDDFSDKMTREPYLNRVNDFEGYKLYKATDKQFSDPTIITDGHGSKMFKEPLVQYDLIDGKFGYCPFGVFEGHGFYLGDETGIKHSYVDTDVQNGRTYYYALVAYDYGIQDLNLSPAENTVDVELDESENIVRLGQNIKSATPRQTAAGYVPPEIAVDTLRSVSSLTRGRVELSVEDPSELKSGHAYKLSFKSSPGRYYVLQAARRHPHDGMPVTTGLQVENLTDSTSRPVYLEDALHGYSGSNGTFDSKLALWRLRTGIELYSDIFDGLRLKFELDNDSVSVDTRNTDWIRGSSPINIQFGPAAAFFAYNYEIRFDSTNAYTAKEDKATYVTDAAGTVITKANLLFKQTFPFRVVNTMFKDSTTNAPEELDMLVYDTNKNGTYDWQNDVILVGYTNVYNRSISWSGTVFTIDFTQVMDASGMPRTGDVYRVAFNRPLAEADSLVFTVRPEKAVDASKMDADMGSIRVVPNPYIATNLMETAVQNKYLNQRRQLLFTHIPANCVISIYTPSGILVDRIDVANAPADGTVHWDLLSREDLEIAAGMYIYHVKSNATGRETLGKFAVIK